MSDSAQSRASPLHVLLRALPLTDSDPGLVLPYAALAMPLAVRPLAGYFRQLPPDTPAPFTAHRP